MPVWLQYYFWLVSISVLCLALERFWPWRRDQKLLRRGIWQDVFWLAFNGHYLGVLLAAVTEPTAAFVNRVLVASDLPALDSLNLIAGMPVWIQFITVFLLKDFVEYGIHRLMHTVPALWEFHKLHHSIEELDWIGNFRFHWGEIVVYKSISYLPLVVLGVDWRVMLVIAILWTLMLDLNHANLSFDWGPLRYVLNSPRMHVWHHDVEVHGKGGQNFGQVLSVWDWMFGTVYWPKDRERPERLGFKGQERYPTGVLGRIVYPFWKSRGGQNARNRV